MWPFRKTSSPPAPEPIRQDSLELRLNSFETRVEALELDNAERQVAVLSALEKVLNQLRARDRSRAKKAPCTDCGDSAGDSEPDAPEQDHRTLSPMAALARGRFRRF